MAIVNAGGLTAQQIIGNVQNKLRALQAAFAEINSEYAWASGVAAADLEAAPISMTAADAQAILTAINDAHAEYLIRTTGTDPNHPPAGAPYVYAASQNAVIGP